MTPLTMLHIEGKILAFYYLAVSQPGLNCFPMSHCRFARHEWVRNEPVHEISNNVVCATSKGSNQPLLVP